MTLLSCVFCIALLTQVLLCCVSHNDDPWCLGCCEPLAVLYDLVRLVGLLCCNVWVVVLQLVSCCAANVDCHAATCDCALTCALFRCDVCVIVPRHVRCAGICC